MVYQLEIRMMNRICLNNNLAIAVMSSLLLFLSGFTVDADLQKKADSLIHREGAINSKNLEAFLDRYVPQKMEEAHVPGLVITIVNKRKVILSRGYGHADLDNKTPMTSRSNLRVGSVSKPVLATAILKLVEQGSITLDVPVSEYLSDFNFKDRLGPAATIAQLLNHTGGYPDTVVKSHTPSIKGWDPLHSVLAADLPPRTIPPGIVMAYSSWDYALLGYVIEKVTGMPYGDAVSKLLFEPLGMTHTTYSQPLPQKIQLNLANGYFYTGKGQYQNVPYDFVRLSPGVALVTNGEDMGRYMISLLNGGKIEGVKVLKTKTMSGVFERQVSAHAASRGRSYVFPETTIAGRNAFYHDGNGIGFYTKLVLFPQHDMGLFLSINHRVFNKKMMLTPAARMMKTLSVEIVKKTIPESISGQPVLNPLPDAKNRIDRYVGQYHLAQISPVDFFKAQAFVDNVTVRNNGDGTLKIGSGNYIEVEPLLFQNLKLPDFFVVFIEDGRGKVEYLSFGGTGSYKKSEWYQSTGFSIVLVGLVTFVFLSVLVIWPIKRHLHWIAFIISVLSLMFVIGVALIFSGMIDMVLFFKRIPLQVYLLFSLPWISGTLTLGLLLFLFKHWRRTISPWWVRLHHLSVTIASLALFWFANFWNFILKW